MRVFRLSRTKYIRDLSGEGARLFGGRWNPKGIPVIYTSTHESLAVLEVLVHSPISNLPDDLQIATISIPDASSVYEVSSESLPDRWHEFPSPLSLKTIGKEWVASQAHLALKVPSAVVPSEYNLLLNPRHEKSDRIKILSVRPFSFDPRLSR